MWDQKPSGIRVLPRPTRRLGLDLPTACDKPPVDQRPGFVLGMEGRFIHDASCDSRESRWDSTTLRFVSSRTLLLQRTFPIATFAIKHPSIWPRDLQT